MKILVLSRDFSHIGGVVNYIELLIRHLNKNNFQVKHFVQGKNPIKWKNTFLPFIIINQLLKFKKILKIYQPDVVHINPSLGWTAIIRDFVFMRIAKGRNIPVLLFVHGWEEHISYKFETKGFWRNYFKKRFRMADAIVVLANEFKNKLVQLGIESHKIHVSTTMVEAEKYFPEEKEFVSSYNILFCANIIKHKGPYEVLDAVRTVLEKHPSTLFTFVGKGKDLDELQEKSKKMGLEHNVEFTGYKTGKEKIDIFKKSHIFAYPSYTEGFPLVILEAMAAGLAIIATPVGGLADALEDGKRGYIIKSMPPEPTEIAEEIIKLIENPELMKKMSENNLKDAKEKYDVKVVSAKIGKIYKEISKR